MKRWMTSLAPNRRTKFVSFTSRLLGESLTWKGGSWLMSAKTHWASASGSPGCLWERGPDPQKFILAPTRSSVPVHTGCLSFIRIGWLRKKHKSSSLRSQVAESWTQTPVFYWIFQLPKTLRRPKGA